MVYIFGPCSAENERQVIETAQAVAALAHNSQSTFIFRAGLWKPRTSPDTFQGVGKAGLPWLQTVQRQFHLSAATEVATVPQLQAALQAGIHYLWIGARTAANPIAVQALADALRSAESRPKAVLIKNPVNEDAALWLGNIRRLEATGTPVMAVHRGCNHHPCWALAYTLHQQRPDIPLLLDPSHMSGDAALVPELCQKASELGLYGLMVEIHPQPAQALSDSRQQLPLSSLSLLLQRSGPSSDIHWLRAMMDETDDALWSVIRQRMALSRRIGDWKKEHHLAVVQPERFRTMLDKRRQWAAEQHISAATVEQIMNALHSESIRHQTI